MAAAPPTPQRILLTGFMGAGKTTVGILLAEQLGWRFLDLDQHLENHHGQSIASLFANHGESHFRTLETEALSSILAARNLVIALGGGALDAAKNREAITVSTGTSLIFLDAPIATLIQRINNQGQPDRPLFAGPADAAARLATRLPHYRTATLHIDTTALDPHSVAANIIQALSLQTLAHHQETS